MSDERLPVAMFLSLAVPAALIGLEAHPLSMRISPSMMETFRATHCLVEYNDVHHHRCYDSRDHAGPHTCSCKVMWEVSSRYE
jgi:hypothetical protein